MREKKHRENIYETVHPYGSSIYEKVDDCDPNKDHKQKKISRDCSRRLKILLIIVLVCIGTLIAVLCPILIIQNKQQIIIATTMTTKTTTTPNEYIQSTTLKITSTTISTEITSRPEPSTIPSMIYCDKEKVLCREQGLTPYCNLTIVDKNGEQMKFCNLFVFPDQLPGPTSTSTSTTTTTTSSTNEEIGSTSFSTSTTTTTTTRPERIPC